MFVCDVLWKCFCCCFNNSPSRELLLKDQVYIKFETRGRTRTATVFHKEQGFGRWDRLIGLIHQIFSCCRVSYHDYDSVQDQLDGVTVQYHKGCAAEVIQLFAYGDLQKFLQNEAPVS